MPLLRPPDGIGQSLLSMTHHDSDGRHDSPWLFCMVQLLTRNTCAKRPGTNLGPVIIQFMFSHFIMTYSIIPFRGFGCPQASFIYALHIWPDLHIPFPSGLDRIPGSPYVLGENCSWGIVIWICSQWILGPIIYEFINVSERGVTHAPWLRIQLAELQFPVLNIYLINQ